MLRQFRWCVRFEVLPIAWIAAGFAYAAGLVVVNVIQLPRFEAGYCIPCATARGLARALSTVCSNQARMPPWGPERITEDGKEQMRALGFNI